MTKRKAVTYVVIAAALVLIAGIIGYYHPVWNGTWTLTLTVSSDVSKDDAYQLFYITQGDGETAGFCEEQSMQEIVRAGMQTNLSFPIPNGTKKIRLDVGQSRGTIKLREIRFHCGRQDITPDADILANIDGSMGISSVSFQDGMGTVVSDSDDPYMIWDFSIFGTEEKSLEMRKVFTAVRKGLACLAVAFLLLVFLRRSDDLFDFAVLIYRNKSMIFQLSVNDFKTKYAGSYLGIFWAFVQPVVTVLVYWFVFEKGLKSGHMANVPFVLWLVAGLIPWFFFSDAWNGATNALIEYHYLVKKVVFQIAILPVVKILSVWYIHVFFVLFTLVLYMGYGYFPDVYTLQVFYYMVCTFVLVLGISFATAAIVAFFKDLSQIIGIVLQIGIWMTPIMWEIGSMGLSERMIRIFQLNPMYYIVSGYRDALIGKVWFYEKMGLTVYFWTVSLIMFVMGLFIFKRLKVHFADVL